MKGDHCLSYLSEGGGLVVLSLVISQQFPCARSKGHQLENDAIF